MTVCYYLVMTDGVIDKCNIRTATCVIHRDSAPTKKLFGKRMFCMAASYPSTQVIIFSWTDVRNLSSAVKSTQYDGIFHDINRISSAHTTLNNNCQWHLKAIIITALMSVDCPCLVRSVFSYLPTHYFSLRIKNVCRWQSEQNIAGLAHEVLKNWCWDLELVYHQHLRRFVNLRTRLRIVLTYRCITGYNITSVTWRCG